MTAAIDRLWWPIPVEPLERQSEETKAKIVFLEQATQQGSRAFVDQSDCGAVAGDGRECCLLWRGKHRCELLLIDGGRVESRKMFADPIEVSAFHQASVEALDWLRSKTGASNPHLVARHLRA